MHIPIIDFKPWSEYSSLEDRRRVAHELVEACHTTGFVYIKNSGLQASIIDEAFAWSKKFFELKEKDRASAAHPEGSMIFRGYSKLGHETLQAIEGGKLEGVPDYTESYGIGSDENPELPNVWIDESILPGFRAFSLKFHAECWRSSELILRALSLGLGLPSEDSLLNFHSSLENELSYRHYPPISEGTIRNGDVDRLGAHTDFDSFTLLFQDSLGGLSVKHPKTANWVDAAPIEGAVVMNIGDALERWNYLTSTMHRVHLPPLEESYDGEGELRMTLPRFSIPYFVAPKGDTLLQRLNIPLAFDKEPKYPMITYKELCRQKTEGMFKY
ncbi:hypothetical protein VTL71DRAFT_794 [Oculimacula yallundae]|uniref:Fe2OG dioxygenase domain-containing protein n=1 Tax=Oculimacula yallundae TaxID=86028 RepID=A0ABR4D123_9HELO